MVPHLLTAGTQPSPAVDVSSMFQTAPVSRFVFTRRTWRPVIFWVVSGCRVRAARISVAPANTHCLEDCPRIAGRQSRPRAGTRSARVPPALGDCQSAEDAPANRHLRTLEMQTAGRLNLEPPASGCRRDQVPRYAIRDRVFCESDSRTRPTSRSTYRPAPAGDYSRDRRRGRKIGVR